VTNKTYYFNIEIVYDGETEPYDPNEQEEGPEKPLSGFSSGFMF
jgi:hypothetical protein